jgi:hypothetical protein
MTETELPGAAFVTYQNPRLVILLHAWNQTVSGLDNVKR